MGAKDRFITDTLRKEGDDMLRRQTARISEILHERSGSLLHDRHISVSDNTLTFIHPTHERYLDMRRRAANERRRGKKRRIHNRYTYGAYASIAERLMYGYTEEVREAYLRLDDSSK